MVQLMQLFVTREDNGVIKPMLSDVQVGFRGEYICNSHWFCRAQMPCNYWAKKGWRLLVSINLL